MLFLRPFSLALAFAFFGTTRAATAAEPTDATPASDSSAEAPAAPPPQPEATALLPTTLQLVPPAMPEMKKRSTAGFRFGVHLGGVIGAAQPEPPAVYGGTGVGVASPTFQLDLGAEVNPEFAIYARGEAGTIVLAAQLAAYGIAEWSPGGRFYLGAGVGWDAMASWMTNPWSGVSVPLIAGVEVWQKAPHALRLELEIAPGIDPATGSLGGHAGLSIGYVRHRIASKGDDLAPVLADPTDTAPDRIRFRFGSSSGVGLVGVPGMTFRDGSAVNIVAFSPTTNVDLGVQWNRHVATYLRGELDSYGGALYLIAEWSPMRGVSIGSGIGYDTAQADTATAFSHAQTFSIPVILGVDLGRWGPNAVRLELEAAGGLALLWGGDAWHSMLTLGYRYN